jgi:hypothetical protein
MIMARRKSGYLYIIRLREHIHQDLEVYKVGRTQDFLSRLKQYPNLCSVLVIEQVLDHVEAEITLLQLLRAHPQLTHRVELGNEYFAGSGVLIKSIFHAVTQSLTPIRATDLVIIDRSRSCQDALVPSNEPDNGTTMMKVVKSYEAVKEEWEQTTCKIMFPGVCFIRTVESNNSVQIFTRDGILKTYEHLGFSRDGRRREPFVAHWMRDEDIRTYNSVQILPPPLEVRPGTLNIWKPFQVQTSKTARTTNLESEGVNAILHHLDIVMGKNAAYLLNWCSQLFQEHGIKSKIAMVFKCDNGAGVNFLTDLLASMIGKEKCCEVSMPCSTLFGSPATTRCNKAFFCINASNGRDIRDKIEILNDAISSTTVVHDVKGMDGVLFNCHARFIFITDKDSVIDSILDSRKLAVFEVSSVQQGDSEYFERLTHHVQDPHTQREFYEFLMMRDISKANLINDRPKRTNGNTRVASNAPYEFRFVADILAKAKLEGMERLTRVSSDLFEEFMAWLETMHVTRYETNAMKFGRKISGLVWSPTHSCGIHSVTKNHGLQGTEYVFEVNAALHEMQDKGWLHY